MDGDRSPKICRQGRGGPGAHQGNIEGKRVGAVDQLALRWTVLRAVLKAQDTISAGHVDACTHIGRDAL